MNLRGNRLARTLLAAAGIVAIGAAAGLLMLEPRNIPHLETSHTSKQPGSRSFGWGRSDLQQVRP